MTRTYKQESCGEFLVPRGFDLLSEAVMATVRNQRAYDHRVRLKVFQGERDITLSHQESIPRSTIATWKARPPKQVVTLACDQMSSVEIERDFLLVENQRLKTKLAAMRSRNVAIDGTSIIRFHI